MVEETLMTLVLTVQAAAVLSCHDFVSLSSWQAIAPRSGFASRIEVN